MTKLFQSFSVSVYKALYTWATLCKKLPGIAEEDCHVVAHGHPTLKSWSSCLTDFSFLFNASKPDYKTVYDLLDTDVDSLKPLDPISGNLLCNLATGDSKNEAANRLYNNMMEHAQHRGMYYALSPTHFLNELFHNNQYHSA